ncbi:MAG TPA: hypothetical protein PK358_08640 [Spirochaetota bacterium]|nr:hypothetical protein [Spirochaetota bacterium]
MRKKRDGSMAFIPPSEFDQYLKEQDIALFIDYEFYNKYKFNPHAIKHAPQTGINDSSTLAHKNKNETYFSSPVRSDPIFKEKLGDAKEMDILERIQTLINGKYQLNNLISDERRFDKETAGELSDIFTKTICINKATLEENLLKPADSGQLGRLLSETEEVVNGLITLLSNGKSSYKDLVLLDFVQTGSNTLNHMNRMLIRLITFLFYYNEYFVSHSNDVKRIRSRFREKFKKYYEKLFDEPQTVNLEIVFKGGIGPVSDKTTFLEYAMGGFFHDIGKLPEIEYHDSDEGFVPVKARRHVFDSYNMLLKAARFSTGTIAIGLLHHDYYNAPYGYRQRETLRKKFERRKIERTDTIITKYCMSQDILDVVYGNSLAYFPSKVLEILDIYDAMTDPDKNYREIIFTPEEALMEIKRQYIEKGQPGIDPILFNIFVDFLIDSRVLPDSKDSESIKV